MRGDLLEVTEQSVQAAVKHCVLDVLFGRGHLDLLCICRVLVTTELALLTAFPFKIQHVEL